MLREAAVDDGIVPIIRELRSALSTDIIIMRQMYTSQTL